jgi:hypothetical protein
MRGCARIIARPRPRRAPRINGRKKLMSRNPLAQLRTMIGPLALLAANVATFATSPVLAQPAPPPVATSGEATEPVDPSALAQPVAPASGGLTHAVDARRMARLESSIMELAEADAVARTWGGVGSVLLGGVVIAAGVLVAVEDDASWGEGGGRAALSGVALATGAGMVATAIYRWLSDTPAEERLARWLELRRSARLESLELGRFEGELAAEAELARAQRRLGAAGALGLVAGGGTLIGFAASSALEGDSKSAGITVGAIAVALGAAQIAALLLIDSPAERAWQHYSEPGSAGFGRLQGAPRARHARLAPELVLERPRLF